MPITPDQKDWTWVLERVCPECGYDAGALERSDFGRFLRYNARAWTHVLAGPDVSVRTHEDRWSTLEYAAHVRDVLALFIVRLDLMLRTDDPTFESWDQDEAAVAEHYDRQDPRAVAEELVAAAATLASAFEAVGPGQWSRTGARSDGSRFTVETLGRYLVHEPVHHLWDVTGTRFEPPAGRSA